MDTQTSEENWASALDHQLALHRWWATQPGHDFGKRFGTNLQASYLAAINRQAEDGTAALVEATRALLFDGLGAVPGIADLDDPADDQWTRWSHRWYVMPHWLTIHRGSGKQRVVRVAGHIKGPEHAPLILRDVVYKWTR